MPNPKDITDPTTAMNMALALLAKAFKLNYSTPTNNNHMISSNPRNRQIAQPGMNMGQDKQMQMVGASVNLGNSADKAPVYDSDGSAEVHDYENYDENKIFNMYTELLEPIPEQHQVLQNDNNFISEVTSVEQSEKTVEQHPVNFEETRALYDSLYQNLAIEVEKANSVNRKLKETNADLTTELARFKKLLLLTHQISKLRLNVRKNTLQKRKKSTFLSQSIFREPIEKTEIDILFLAQQKSKPSMSTFFRENAHLKARYKNLFGSISMSRTQTKTIIASLQKQLHNSIYENAKLRAQLFKKVSVQKDIIRGTSKNTKFVKQSILGKPPMLGEIHALLKPVTSNLVPTPQESKVVKNNKVITPGIFRINPFKTFREENHVPNNVRASARTKPITISQHPVITKKDVNSYLLQEKTTLRPEGHNLGAIQRMIGSHLRLRVVKERIKELM
nr:hypothetical protein [Tanacetum cinerariifolium]